MKKAESGPKWAINFQLEWSLRGISCLTMLRIKKHSSVLRMLMTTEYRLNFRVVVLLPF